MGELVSKCCHGDRVVMVTRVVIDVTSWSFDDAKHVMKLRHETIMGARVPRQRIKSPIRRTRKARQRIVTSSAILDLINMYFGSSLTIIY